MFTVPVCTENRKLYYIFKRFTQNCEIAYLRHVCLFIRKEQLGSHWTDFQNVIYLRIFRKSVKKFKFH